MKNITAIILVLLLANSCASKDMKVENNVQKEIKIQERKQSKINTDFQIFELDGRLLRMEVYKGNPYIIALWNTHDNQSIENLKQLSKLKNKYGDKINILALSEEHVSKHIQFKNKTKLPFSFYKINQHLKGLKIGTNYLFDQTGNFVSEIKSNSYIAIENQFNQ